ncbi:hypothetical protein WANG_0889 [Lactobacillus kefiranofaciens subsp. kefiranofaciens]|nr:hypothetical protein WANG_0889 [Lactobacillus kefiranofaciens subsp. kefiranofaciens]
MLWKNRQNFIVCTLNNEVGSGEILQNLNLFRKTLNILFFYKGF